MAKKAAKAKPEITTDEPVGKVSEETVTNSDVEAKDLSPEPEEVEESFEKEPESPDNESGHYEEEEFDEPSLKIGESDVDLNKYEGVASAVRDAIEEESLRKEEERGAPTVKAESSGPTEEPEKSSVRVKIRNSNQEKVSAFFKEAERKKKLARERDGK